MLNERFVKEIKSGQFFFRETHINPGNCVFVLKNYVTISIILNSENFREKKGKIYFKNFTIFLVTTRKGSTGTHSRARAGMPGE